MYSEFRPVTCVRDLEHLDAQEVAIGYHHGVFGCCPPTSAHSRAYWHGYRNGAVDGGHCEESEDQRAFRVVMHLSAHQESPWRN
jgi:hypothetical protein